MRGSVALGLSATSHQCGGNGLAALHFLGGVVMHSGDDKPVPMRARLEPARQQFARGGIGLGLRRPQRLEMVCGELGSLADVQTRVIEGLDGISSGDFGQLG